MFRSTFISLSRFLSTGINPYEELNTLGLSYLLNTGSLLFILVMQQSKHVGVPLGVDGDK